MTEFTQNHVLVTPNEFMKACELYRAFLEGREISPAKLWPGMLPLYERRGKALIVNLQGYLARVVDPFIQSMGATSFEEARKILIQGISVEVQLYSPPRGQFYSPLFLG